MDEQLWPLYAISAAFGLYVLKGVWDYCWYEGIYRSSQSSLETSCEYGHLANIKKETNETD